MIGISVSINSPKFKQACVFQAMGFQTDTKIFCTTAIKGDALEFKSYSDGGILNEFGNERYKVGEVLLTLKHVKDQKNKNKYAVHWGSYVPFDDMSQANKYFEKTGGG